MNRSKRVYVVGGRDDLSMVALKEFLEASGLMVVPWPGSRSLLTSMRPLDQSLLEGLFSGAQATIVLLTGDELGKPNPVLKASGSSKFHMSWSLQPTPNTLFEAGIAVGVTPERTILTRIGKLRPLHKAWEREILLLDNSIKCRRRFLDRLIEIGCVLENSSDRWMDAGDFERSKYEPISTEIVANQKEMEPARSSLPSVSEADQAFLRAFDSLLKKSFIDSVSPVWIAKELELGLGEVEDIVERLADLGYIARFKQIGRTKYALSQEGKKALQVV